MPILVEPDSTTAGVLVSALPSGSPVVARPDDVDGLLTGRGHSAVVIGPTIDMPTATALAERIRVSYPATTVVLIRHELQPEVFAQAMQFGIGAVVAADDWPALSTALGRAKSTWETIQGPTSPGRTRRQGVHGLLAQGRRRQDDDGGQPQRRPVPNRRAGVCRGPRPRLR